MRLGIFGGTFDPVHLGHLLLAEFCREQCRLDAVWFIPAAVPPHKQGAGITRGDRRAEMLELAIGGHESFSVCRRELDRGGVSFTYQTLEAIKTEDPSRELFLLMGGDSLRDLPTWREPARICELAIPVVARRDAAETLDSTAPRDATAPCDPHIDADFSAIAPLVSAERLAEIRASQISFPRIEISSRELRRRVAAGESIRYQTPRAVEEYIRTHGLYRERDATQRPGKQGTC